MQICAHETRVNKQLYRLPIHPSYEIFIAQPAQKYVRPRGCFPVVVLELEFQRHDTRQSKTPLNARPKSYQEGNFLALCLELI